MNAKVEKELEGKNVLYEYEPGKFAWITCGKDEDGLFLSYINFSENDYLDKLPICDTSKEIFDKLKDMAEIETVYQNDTRFEDYSLEFLSMQKNSIYYGELDYPKMFCGIVTTLYQEGR